MIKVSDIPGSMRSINVKKEKKKFIWAIKCEPTSVFLLEALWCKSGMNNHERYLKNKKQKLV